MFARMCFSQDAAEKYDDRQVEMNQDFCELDVTPAKKQGKHNQAPDRLKDLQREIGKNDHLYEERKGPVDDFSNL